MSEAVSSANTVGSYADLRWKVSADSRQSVAADIADAAHWAARVTHGGYDRMSRFTSSTARTASALNHGVYGRTVTAYDRLCGHMSSLHASARQGIDTAIRNRLAFRAELEAKAADRRRPRAPRPGILGGVRGAAKVVAEVTPVNAFARAVIDARRQSSRWRAPRDTAPVDVAADKPKLRQRVAAMSLGAMMSSRLAIDNLMEKAAGMRRFFSSGSRTVSSGITAVRDGVAFGARGGAILADTALAMAAHGLARASAGGAALVKGVKDEAVDTARFICTTPYGRMTALMAGCAVLVAAQHIPGAAESMHVLATGASDAIQLAGGKAHQAWTLATSETIGSGGKIIGTVHTNAVWAANSLADTYHALVAQAASYLGHSQGGHEIVTAAVNTADHSMHAVTSGAADPSAHAVAAAVAKVAEHAPAAVAKVAEHAPAAVAKVAEHAPAAVAKVAEHHQGIHAVVADVHGTAAKAHHAAQHAVSAPVDHDVLTRQTYAATNRLAHGATDDNTPFNAFESMRGPALSGADLLNGFELSQVAPHTVQAPAEIIDAARDHLHHAAHAPHATGHAASLADHHLAHARACANSGVNGACTVQTVTPNATLHTDVSAGSHHLTDSWGRTVQYAGPDPAHTVTVSLPTGNFGV